MFGAALLFSGLIGVQNASAADNIPPTVGMPTYSGSVYVNASEMISATYLDTAPPGDTAGIANCRLVVNGSEQALATLSATSSASGTANASHTFGSAGSVEVNMRCTDNGSNVTTSATSTITVIADTTAPTVSAVSPSTSVRASSTQFSVNYSDSGSGVTNCVLYVQQGDGTYNTYAMTENGGMASGSSTQSFTYSSSMTAGSYGQYATCSDASGNVGTGSVTAITLTTAPAPDTTNPVVSSVNPGSATVGVTVSISASYTDAMGVTSCSLYIDGNLIGVMDRSGTTTGLASRNHTFSTAGTYAAQARCSDAVGNVGSASTNVSVTTGTAAPYVRRLIKLMCPTGFVDVNHPCKAVYYVGGDNKRHAFPNEKVYFTWYSDFSGVIEVDSSTMASITLGRNVAYRPGTRMVKFTTLNRTYAVSRYGTLRWVTSEAAARALYGNDWNRMIDDISDAFYTDYSFGADINSTADYNPAVEASSVSTIDMNLN